MLQAFAYFGNNIIYSYFRGFQLLELGKFSNK
jgi:hypothetical protein